MYDQLNVVIIVGTVVLAILIGVAPLACWVMLVRIHRTLQTRLPSDGARVEYQLAKITQAVTAAPAN